MKQCWLSKQYLEHFYGSQATCALVLQHSKNAKKRWLGWQLVELFWFIQPTQELVLLANIHMHIQLTPKSQNYYTSLWFVTRVGISTVQSCSICIKFPGYLQSSIMMIICFGFSFYRWLTCWKSGHHDWCSSHVIRLCRISYQSFCHLGRSLAAR